MHLMSARYSTGQYICKKYGHISCKMNIAEMIVLGVAKEWHSILYEYKKEEYKKVINSKILQLDNIINTQKDNITRKQDKIDRIEDRYYEGKIDKERADKLEKRTFNELQGFKRIMEQAEADKKRLVDDMNNDKISKTDREIVIDVVEKVILNRVNKCKLLFTIINRYTGEIRKIETLSKSGKIININIKMRDTLYHY